mmetsp:Transcript_6846/g.21678  ORF Transcript_6846/g.21678 Transcript_6846/m.21678 type:complete len:317 (-) Transcript_6846:4575-5525(-)
MRVRPSSSCPSIMQVYAPVCATPVASSCDGPASRKRQRAKRHRCSTASAYRPRTDSECPTKRVHDTTTGEKGWSPSATSAFCSSRARASSSSAVSGMHTASARLRKMEPRMRVGALTLSAKGTTSRHAATASPALALGMMFSWGAPWSMQRELSRRVRSEAGIGAGPDSCLDRCTALSALASPSSPAPPHARCMSASSTSSTPITRSTTAASRRTSAASSTSPSSSCSDTSPSRRSHPSASSASDSRPGNLASSRALSCGERQRRAAVSESPRRPLSTAAARGSGASPARMAARSADRTSSFARRDMAPVRTMRLT